MNFEALLKEDLVSFFPTKPTSYESAGHQWGLAHIAGRFIEISSTDTSANLTAAFGLVLEAQRLGEPAAWITLPQSSFYPPDAAEGGVDLNALPVVRAPDPRAAARAADQLIRSGAFGLVVLDLGYHSEEKANQEIPVPLQSRLAGLAKKYTTALIALTEKSCREGSLGSLISLRAEAERIALKQHQETNKEDIPSFEVQIRVLKDKRRGPGLAHQEICHGPAGLY